MRLNEKCETNIKIYKPNRDIGLGFSIWKEMFSELIQSKELILRFSIRNISARYKQSVLGVVWIFILPLFAVGTFIYLNYSGVLILSKTPIPYPAYALLGVTLWQLFATGIIACTGSLTEAGKLIGKINFAKESLILSSFVQSLFEFVIRIILIGGIFIIYKIEPSWTIIFIPIALIPLILLTLGMGFILATLNGIFRDTTHIVSLVTTFLLFITPILYPPPTVEPMATLNRINPIGILVIGARDLVIEGGITQPINFIYASIFALFFFLSSWRSFHIMEPRIAERV